MISKPTANCPKCHGKLTVLDAIDVSLHADTVTYYCECDCGAANMTVRRGEVIRITPCPPIDIPEYFDVPTPDSQEYNDYPAQ